MRFEYRPEIDGLRALAVVPVIFFHAGFAAFAGGFVGVDVFFVISGYLITSIILGELTAGTFSLGRFYERRARRILPALCFIVLLCVPVAWTMLQPADLADFAQSLVAVSLFSSNFLFWLESGYFDGAAELKPLLHTWSLAVEEQYYILFPLFLMFFWRYGRRRIQACLVMLLIASLGLAHWGAYAHPSATFYLLPTRGWEILAGALAAFYLRDRGMPAAAPIRQAGSLAGLAMILMAIFLFNARTPFPSLYALLPVLGTVLIILFAGQGMWVNRLLANRAMVGIGLVSYSAYLWHQPLFAFTRYGSLNEPGTGVMLALCALTLPLAWLSWKFIETPFRKTLPARIVVGSALATCCGVILVGIVLPAFKTHLVDGVFLLTEARIESEKQARFALYSSLCEERGRDICEQPSETGRNVLIIGDSHAMDALNILQPVFAGADDMTFVLNRTGGCPPHPDIRTLASANHPNLAACVELNRQRYDPDYINRYDILVINLLFNWYKESHLADYLAFLGAEYRGKVVVFGGAFAFNRDLPLIINAGGWDQDLEQYLRFDPRGNEASLRKAVEAKGYLFLSKTAVFCPDGVCRFVDGDRNLMTYDEHHLSRAAAALLSAAHRDALLDYIDGK